VRIISQQLQKKNKVKERAVTKVAHLESLGGQQNYLGFLA